MQLGDHTITSFKDLRDQSMQKWGKPQSQGNVSKHQMQLKSNIETQQATCEYGEHNACASLPPSLLNIYWNWGKPPMHMETISNI